ncbi:ephrin-A3 isoform X2 [Sander lucioperca]|uniref:ephrin-A3 isoform X2 n=1 Tax=Sander lucioperca TaxID=283035 RepID=UPI00125D605E|nr:ephrin-A3 isoform X2 [Sander lucioperca]
MALATFSLSLITLALTDLHLSRASDRHAVYWNSSNLQLRREGYTVQVSVNDYLDIYCPHYNTSQRGTLERTVAEQYILYMVSYRGYRTCDPQLGFKRWECNRPHAPHAPIKFSEKFQRYSAFSLGYEFNVGQEYYYISTPTHHHGHSCLRLRVYVCCSTDEFNPEVPKLEKSVSGSSPSRDRLLLTVAMLLVSAVLLS